MFLVLCGTYFTEVWVGVVGFTSKTLVSTKFQFGTFRFKMQGFCPDVKRMDSFKRDWLHNLEHESSIFGT